MQKIEKENIFDFETVAKARSIDGIELKQFRTELGFTQEGLAKVLGITVGAVRHWEQNRNGTPPYLILVLDQLRDKKDIADFLRRRKEENKELLQPLGID